MLALELEELEGPIVTDLVQVGQASQASHFLSHIDASLSLSRF